MATKEEIIEKFKEFKEQGVAQIYQKSNEYNTIVITWAKANYLDDKKEDTLPYNRIYTYINKLLNNPEGYGTLKYGEALGLNGVVRIGDEVLFTSHNSLLKGYVQKFSDLTVHFCAFEEQIGKKGPWTYINRNLTMDRVWKL